MSIQVFNMSKKNVSRCQVHDEGDRGADVGPSHPRGNDRGMLHVRNLSYVGMYTGKY